MTQKQLNSLNHALNKAPRSLKFVGTFESILNLKKTHRAEDGSVELGALHPRQQWLLHFVNRDVNPLFLDDILSAAEKSVLRTSKRKLEEVEAVETSLVTGPLNPESVDAAYKEASLACVEFEEVQSFATAPAPPEDGVVVDVRGFFGSDGESDGSDGSE